MLRRIPPAQVLVPRILILSGLALCGSALKADSIFSNFNNADTPTFQNQTGIIVTNDASDFSVAEELPTLSSSYNLSDIQVAVSTQDNPPQTDTITVGIYADNSGVPAATPLESLSYTGTLFYFYDTEDIPPILTFTSQTNPELLAGNNYWIVMDGLTTESLIWYQNLSRLSGVMETNGTAGDYPPPLSNPNASETSGVLEVDGTLVEGGGPAAPEPGTWLLLITGIGTLAVMRQARR